ncbi:MAG TPA: ABC transporter permease [Syntrophothermus lipocalidus]|uniref:Cell division protein FtsX n=1 Tax=Syntrophothermus lipocalidus (strain DSM 12680 / TGB-C1) TaxID=643648 RepID=D7CPJ0_SYNLT|nr:MULTISPECIES: permease-like cell division protein FtsX [Syntrophothermus]ADI02625.1 protein of unknown function DUF214 [Syntrophothermus lipocalidus DSM 12680]NSW83940.1 ABC transporter permease [Syntrophothermus sp.]HHV76150.1 ABC transporter permease [Syntrophothermus lipocalidus]HOV43163.1 permease-like cell division protein FtsX [Syntrophothermus lipocalidus]
MSLRNVGYYFGEAARSLYRNRLLSLATASTVAACVLILGVAVLMIVNAEQVMSNLESDVEIVAFLEKDLSHQQETEIGKELSYIPEVKEVRYVSRDEAMKQLAKKFGKKESELIQTLGGENPLRNSYRIKANDPHQVPSLARKIQGIPGIYRVRYGQGVVEKLFAATRWVRNLSLVVTVLLAGAGVFLIATTIRLSVYSRRKEIYLMQLVGATRWFIRWPFFIEGIILGIAGSAVAALVLSVGYYYLVNSLGLAVSFIPLVRDTSLLWKLGGGLLATGAALGIIGTYISVNRYMNI